MSGNMTRTTVETSDADVAKRMFFGGCAALPWLWCVNSYHYRQHLRGPNADPEIQKCTCTASAALATWLLTLHTLDAVFSRGREVVHRLHSVDHRADCVGNYLPS